MDNITSAGASADSAAGLDELEHIIARGLANFIDVGHALLEIQNRRLYRDVGYGSFAVYVTERWDISPAHAYRQIDAAKVIDILSPIGETSIPANEAQARELVPLVEDPNAVRSVWTETVQATGNRVTARAVRVRVAARTGLAPTRRNRNLSADGLTCPACGHRWAAE